MCSTMTAEARNRRMSVSRLSRPVKASPIVVQFMASPPSLPFQTPTCAAISSLTYWRNKIEGADQTIRSFE